MKLVHFTDKPLGPIEPREQKTDRRFGEYMKPAGLWVSDEDDYGWSQWCRDEEFGPERLALAYEVTLAAEANVLHIDSVDALDEFTDEYGRPLAGDWPISTFGPRRAIDWPAVAAEYRGLIITPYLYQRRLSMGHGWYYGWDCASGCIWDPAAIASVVEKIEEAKA